MKKFQQDAIIITLIDKLEERGSWCGKTHILKATYFLKELMNVPLDAKFILYKHGPFSFDLYDTLDFLVADSLLKSDLKPYPYGARYSTTDLSKKITEKAPKTLKKYGHKIDFVADKLGGKNVMELERMATALYVILNKNDSKENKARRIHELKPHISEEKATVDLEIVYSIIYEASNKFEDLKINKKQDSYNSATAPHRVRVSVTNDPSEINGINHGTSNNPEIIHKNASSVPCK